MVRDDDDHDGTERNGTGTEQNGFHDFTRKLPYFDKFGLPEAQILGISIFLGDLAFSIGPRPSNPKKSRYLTLKVA